jgi:sugar O-acyltransferase (sialic acid O-acetyltransferase NeuD family)
MKKKILLIGCGGHTKVCAEVIKGTGKFNISGVICNDKKGIFNIPQLGSDKDLKRLKKKFNYAFITIGQIKNHKIRKNIYKNLKSLKYNIPKIISKNAITSNSAKIGNGTIVMNNAVIHQDVNIGNNCIINTGAIIEHDVRIGDNSHISTGAIINGSVKIGNNVFIGSGSIIVNDIQIKSNSFIKAGSLIKKSI